MAHYASSAPIGREVMRVSPVPESSKYAMGPLVDALDKRVEKTGRNAPQVSLRPSVPDDTLSGNVKQKSASVACIYI